MRRATGLLLALGLLLAGCGGDDDEAAPSAAPGAVEGAGFPVTIDHALGTTEIPARPERVVTLGYGEGDIVAALGIVPVAVNAYGARDGAPTPWFREAVDDADVELLDLAGGIPFERIAALDPDVVLALTSDIERSDYELLSAIAPTVAYQVGPFRDAWQDAAVTAGRALGLEDEAQDLVDGAESGITDAAAAHPALDGRTASVVLAISPDQVGVLNSVEENTVRMLTELGMELPPAVDALEVGPTGYSAVLSQEQVGLLDADVVLLYALSDAARAALTSNPVYGTLDAVARGDVLPIEPAVWSALRTPSVLAVPYALERLVDPIVAAVEG